MATCMQLAGLLDNGNLRDKAVGACLEVRLDMLRKAIASIVVGATE